ncbi:MAG: cupin domain-containing protein [Gammaproteobacteria bacterium]|nr:cupin domain-containing protein [Gammaproteobacteria bacterium]
MASSPPKIHIDSVKKTTIGNGKNFAASIGRIGTQLGMTKLGCTTVELEPGKRAWPHHLHYGQEELFIVIEGQGTLRYDDKEYEIRQGEIFFAGTGPGTAHQIVNTSDAKLRYLALSSMADPEVCYYPDSKKYGAYCWRDDGKGVRFLAHDDSGVDYFDGEQ